MSELVNIGYPGADSPQAMGGDAALASPGGGDPALPPSAAEEMATFTAWAAALFHLAEEGVNPGVNDFWDAYHYVATSLSVGYSNIFPVTPAGKVIGAVVMMVGPALSARALNPREEPPQQPVSDPVLLQKLDAILEELKRINSSA